MRKSSKPTLTVYGRKSREKPLRDEVFDFEGEFVSKRRLLGRVETVAQVIDSSCVSILPAY